MSNILVRHNNRQPTCLCYQKLLGVDLIDQRIIGFGLYARIAMMSYLAIIRATCRLSHFPAIYRALQDARRHVIGCQSTPDHHHCNILADIIENVREHLIVQYYADSTGRMPWDFYMEEWDEIPDEEEELQRYL